MARDTVSGVSSATDMTDPARVAPGSGTTARHRGGWTGVVAAVVTAVASYALLIGTVETALCSAPLPEQVDSLVQAAALLLGGLLVTSFGAIQRARDRRGQPSDRALRVAVGAAALLLLAGLVVVTLIMWLAVALDYPFDRGALAAAVGFSPLLAPPLALGLTVLAIRRVRPGRTSPRSALVTVAAVQLAVYAVGVSVYLGSEPWRCG